MCDFHFFFFYAAWNVNRAVVRAIERDSCRMSAPWLVGYRKETYFSMLIIREPGSQGRQHPGELFANTV
jgi:hypothetical protein